MQKKWFAIIAGCVVAYGAQGQPANATGQGTPATPSTPSAAPTEGLPPGLEKRDQLPPGLEGRDQLPPGLAKRTNQFVTTPETSATNTLASTNQVGATATRFNPNQPGVTNQFGGASQNGAVTNQFGDTNQFGTNTNGFGVTNQFGTVTNATPLTPTGTPGSTNRVYSTNSINLNQTNQTTITAQDLAFSERDRTLLLQVRQTVMPRLQAAGAWAPIHFRVNEGVVTLLGTVQTIVIKQQIETFVIQTPGVVQVVNQLIVAAGGQGMSETDQALLVRLRQAVPPRLRAIGVTTPIDFNVQNGIVSVVGTLPTGVQRDRIVTIIQQVPGVVQVQ
jgi:hypothetical protein